MRSLGLTAVALAALTLPGTAQAQRVTADIAIQQGPISGHVIVGDHYRPRPVYREYVVVRQYRGGGWYRNHGYHPMRVYWDGYRYYDRPYRVGLRAVWVYEHGGRYYHDERNDYRRRVDRRDDRYDRDVRSRHDNDRYDRDDHRDRHDHDRNDYRGRNGRRN
jgi:hypothetical protein